MKTRFVIILAIGATIIALLSISALYLVRPTPSTSASTSTLDVESYAIHGWLWNEVYGYTVLGPSSDPKPPGDITEAGLAGNIGPEQGLWNPRGCTPGDLFCYLPYTAGKKSYGLSMERRSPTMYYLHGHAWNSNAGWISFKSEFFNNETGLRNGHPNKSAPCPDTNSRARLVKEADGKWRMRGCAKVVNSDAPLGFETLYLGPLYKNSDPRLEIIFNPATKKFLGYAWAQKTGLWTFGSNTTGLTVTVSDLSTLVPDFENQGSYAWQSTPGKIIGFTAEPESVRKGETVRISWRMESTYECVLRKNSSDETAGVIDISGSTTPDPLDSASSQVKVDVTVETDSIFSLSCREPATDETPEQVFSVREKTVRILPTSIWNRVFSWF